MGVCYSYYDSKRHREFDMGKWYGWSDDGVAVRMLFLPRELLIAELDGYMNEAEWESDNEYATWLADKLIEFRAGGSPEDFQWVNDCDDSDDETFNCAICKKWIDAYGDYPLLNQCECEVPQPCKQFGSRFTDDYTSVGRFKNIDTSVDLESEVPELPNHTELKKKFHIGEPPPKVLRGMLGFNTPGEIWPAAEFDSVNVPWITLPPESDVWFALQPRIIFRPQRLCFEKSDSHRIMLTSLRVRNEELFTTPMNVDFLLDPNVMLEYPTLVPECGVILGLANESKRPIILKCWFEGIYVEE